MGNHGKGTCCIAQKVSLWTSQKMDLNDSNKVKLGSREDLPLFDHRKRGKMAYSSLIR